MLVFNSLKHLTSQEQSLKRKEKNHIVLTILVNHDKGILLLINQIHTNFFFFFKRRIKTTKFEGSNKFKYILKIEMKKAVFL